MGMGLDERYVERLRFCKWTVWTLRNEKENNAQSTFFVSFLFRPNKTICWCEYIFKRYSLEKRINQIRLRNPAATAASDFKICLLWQYFFYWFLFLLFLLLLPFFVFMFVLEEAKWLCVPLCQNIGDTADACRRRLMRCPASPKPGSSSGPCSRGLQRRKRTGATVPNCWHLSMQQYLIIYIVEVTYL